MKIGVEGDSRERRSSGQAEFGKQRQFGAGVRGFLGHLQMPVKIVRQIPQHGVDLAGRKTVGYNAHGVLPVLFIDIEFVFADGVSGLTQSVLSSSCDL